MKYTKVMAKAGSVHHLTPEYLVPNGVVSEYHRTLCKRTMYGMNVMPEGKSKRGCTECYQEASYRDQQEEMRRARTERRRIDSTYHESLKSVREAIKQLDSANPDFPGVSSALLSLRSAEQELEAGWEEVFSKPV